VRTVADGRVAGVATTGMGRTFSGRAGHVNGFAELRGFISADPRQSDPLGCTEQNGLQRDAIEYKLYA
jgi:hypothetical protein